MRRSERIRRSMSCFGEERATKLRVGAMAGIMSEYQT